MGVYTNLPQDQIEALINQYDRGKPIQISPIAGGIENSNFFVVLSQFELEQSYVLTLIEVADESRANQITQLMTHLSFYGFPVPEVITARTGHRLIKEGTHPVMLSEKVAGHHVMKPRAEHCQQLGSTLAQFHQIASAFSSPPPQPYDPLWLTSIIAAQSPHISSATLTRLYEAATQYEMIQGSGLPNGWTHGDAFRDNVLFTDTGELSALLDYFHAGEDCLMMDLAIALNDWCYASTSEAERSALCQAMIHGYEAVRPLEREERRALPTLQVVGAARLFCSRLATRDAAGLYRKDPREYENLLGQLSNEPPIY